MAGTLTSRKSTPPAVSKLWDTIGRILPCEATTRTVHDMCTFLSTVAGARREEHAPPRNKLLRGPAARSVRAATPKGRRKAHATGEAHAQRQTMINKTHCFSLLPPPPVLANQRPMLIAPSLCCTCRCKVRHLQPSDSSFEAEALSLTIELVEL